MTPVRKGLPSASLDYTDDANEPSAQTTAVTISSATSIRTVSACRGESFARGGPIVALSTRQRVPDTAPARSLSASMVHNS